MSDFKLNVKVGLTLAVVAILLFSLKYITPQSPKDIYLYAFYKGDGINQESIFYAVSYDGCRYAALNNNSAILDAGAHSSSGGLRDPYIIRTKEDLFYMTATDLHVMEQGWNNTAMVLFKSNDMVNWSSTIVDLKQMYPDAFGDVIHVWSPEVIFDEQTERYMIYFSALKPGGVDEIYYAYVTTDFTGFESVPLTLYTHPLGAACQDPTVHIIGDSCVLIYRSANGLGLFEMASSTELNRGYTYHSRIDLGDSICEGYGNQLVRNDSLNGYFFIYYNSRQKQLKRYFTDNLITFEEVKREFNSDFNAVKGSVVKISKVELNQLVEVLSLKNAVQANGVLSRE